MVSGTKVEFDIVALRSDDNATIEWLDNGHTSKTEWEMAAQKLPRRSGQQRSHPLYMRGRKQTARKEELPKDGPCGHKVQGNTFVEAFREHNQQSQVEFDIVALREDNNASVEWLDQGCHSTTLWRTLKVKFAAASALSAPSQRRQPTRGYRNRLRQSLPVKSTSGEGQGQGQQKALDNKLSLMPAEEPALSEASTSTPMESQPNSSRGISRRQCDFCSTDVQGFGDVCAACRKSCGKGEVRECRNCNHFFWSSQPDCQDCRVD